MSNIDDYMQEVQDDNLGQKAADKVKSKAKGAAKNVANNAADAAKKGAKKVAKKAAKKLESKLVKTKGGAAAVKGAKAIAAGTKAVLSFLASPPVGWICSAILFFIIINVLNNINDSNVDILDGGESTTIDDNGDITLVDEAGKLTDEGILLLVTDCPESIKNATGEVNTDMMQLDVAQKIYSVFSTYGMSDICIAGMIGNFEGESGIDPTRIEGIHDEPYMIGPKEQAALSNLDAYVRGPITAAYGGSISSFYFTGTGGKGFPGMGLGQWTGCNAEIMMAVAEGVGMDWFDLDYQLAYLVGDTHYRPGLLTNWKESPSLTTNDATSYFMLHFEGITNSSLGFRQLRAQYWYDQFSSWTVDSTYAESIFAMANDMGAEASDNAVAKAAENCDNESAYDNSNMATAAVSYAYPKQSQGIGNNGTALYQKVHKNIWGADGLFMSCDRGVATAVRWSGFDDEFKIGNTNNQHEYMASSPKWKSIGDAMSLSIEDLQPGDIFVISGDGSTHGHIVMYVGTEIIQKIHGGDADPSSNSVSASLGSRSPGCGADATEYLNGGDHRQGTSLGDYEVFRCIEPDNSETYKNAGSSAVYEDE